MIAIILTGHIRDSFKNNYIRNLANRLNADLYIHTWSMSEASQSWRPLLANSVVVTEKYIYEHLPENRIKSITIEVEAGVKLKGRTIGPVNKSIGIPIRCQKGMWHGITAAAKTIPVPNKYKYVLRVRFDMYNVQKYFTDISSDMECITALSSKICKDSNVDITVIPTVGVDNLFAMKADKAYDICSSIYHNYDDTLLNPLINGCNNQEFIMLIYLKYMSPFELLMLININNRRVLSPSDVMEILGTSWRVKMNKIIVHNHTPPRLEPFKKPKKIIKIPPPPNTHKKVKMRLKIE